MLGLTLKQIDLSARALDCAAMSWRHQGWEAVLETPPRDGLWLPLADSERRWQGWLRLQDWLENAAPELAGLAASAGVERLVVPWLAAVHQPLVLPMPELDYQRLWLGEPVPGADLPQGPMLRVMAEQGPLWLVQVPESGVSDAKTLAGLSWPLRFVIGDSRVSLSLFGRVAPGDVLLISAPLSEVRCYEKTLGCYQQYEEGIAMEYQEQQDVQDNADIVHNMGQLPVQLEFVLHNHRVTLAGLQNLYQGQLLTLPVDAERRVEIRANGARVGHGELVQLDGQLGVEVHEWLGESGDDE
ncbi:YscQ/HrcQ family type III secretion apparatus protein [Pluralibacter sp.]|uniref:YscQ/HrcQ family type III secretion apparatus protein n=1 Tax=Pluralibacter sp. TaxID=1920032 RepID=UPI0025DAA529|nr:YscQ/HrcQ family type III secretion apparatus protein [Pluralibacter sp.]MBV8045302.1 YscQ/HrcQ family type III secretion apparatus protein [Pluralibacter sp.]